MADELILTAEERAKVIKWMTDTQQQYLNMVEHVTDAQWNWRPAPFRWTVGEVAEHIMLTAHLTGSAIVIVCPKEAAEYYQERLLSYGLTATIEPD